MNISTIESQIKNLLNTKYKKGEFSKSSLEGDVSLILKRMVDNKQIKSFDNVQISTTNIKCKIYLDSNGGTFTFKIDL
jgi:hypothetical protein